MHWPWTFSAHPIPQRYDSFQAHVRMANMENTSSTTSPYPRSNKIHHVDKDKAGLELRGENGRRGIRGKEIRYTNLLAFWFKRERNEIITYVSHNWWRWRSFIRYSGPQGIKGPCAAIYPVPQVTKSHTRTLEGKRGFEPRSFPNCFSFTAHTWCFPGSRLWLDR